MRVKEVLGRYSKDQKLLDPHVHTKSSDGNVAAHQIIEIAVASNILHAIAITDHNTIAPSIEAMEYVQKRGYTLEIISGSEISTSNGHLLALFIENDIPRNKPVEETIREIHRLGGLAIAPHPFFRRIRSLGTDNILDVIHNEDPEIYFDGFEILNAGVYRLNRKIIEQAKLFYLSYQNRLGAAIGASDNHYYTPGLGLTAYTQNPKDAIKSRKTSVLVLEESEIKQIRNIALDLFPKEIQPLVRKLDKLREQLRNRIAT